MNALTYTFSRREKALIALFATLLIGLCWYQFVYIRTSDQMTQLEARIQTVQSNIEVGNTKAAQMRQMERTIEERKVAGVKAKPIPEYDNLKPLMNELHEIMADTDDYVLTFDALDTESTTYVQRGIGMSFDCPSYAAAEKIIIRIADGDFPCLIDSVSIAVHYSINLGTISTLNGNNNREENDVTATLHVVFFEKPVENPE